MRTIVNIAANSLRRNNLGVMLKKVYLRFHDHRHARQASQAATWCVEHAVDWSDFARQLDPALWEETQQACLLLKQKAQEKLDRLGLDLGGGGNYPLLYFMTRYVKPRAVVETGVAAGWSSMAILAALRRNGESGRLYSSDFPYFRLKNPEQYIGYVVDDELKSKWNLFIEGDRTNLSKIATQTGEIDLFHYDSDKTYSGRAFAMGYVESKLSSQAVVIFDDIQDNFHFRDLVTERAWPFRVFVFEGKYLGVTGTLLESLER